MASRGFAISTGRPRASSGANGRISSAPASLNAKLPNARRRAAAFCATVPISASKPLPRFAPITRHSATFSEITPDEASVAVSKTAARLE